MIFKYQKSCSAKRSSTVRHLDQLRVLNLYNVFGVMLICGSIAKRLPRS